MYKLKSNFDRRSSYIIFPISCFLFTAFEWFVGFISTWPFFTALKEIYGHHPEGPSALLKDGSLEALLLLKEYAIFLPPFLLQLTFSFLFASAFGLILLAVWIRYICNTHTNDKPLYVFSFNISSWLMMFVISCVAWFAHLVLTLPAIVSVLFLFINQSYYLAFACALLALLFGSLIASAKECIIHSITLESDFTKVEKKLPGEIRRAPDGRTRIFSIEPIFGGLRFFLKTAMRYRGPYLAWLWRFSMKAFCFFIVAHKGGLSHLHWLGPCFMLFNNGLRGTYFLALTKSKTALSSS